MVLEEGEILLTLDGSTSSEAAVLPALQLTRVYGAPLRVLTVVDLDPAAHAPSSGTPGDRFERYARDLLVR
ncbi:MAG: universal stress protein, partial [Tepidiformaceae bacterium]